MPAEAHVLRVIGMGRAGKAPDFLIILAPSVGILHEDSERRARGLSRKIPEMKRHSSFSKRLEVRCMSPFSGAGASQSGPDPAPRLRKTGNREPGHPRGKRRKPLSAFCFRKLFITTSANKRQNPFQKLRHPNILQNRKPIFPCRIFVLADVGRQFALYQTEIRGRSIFPTTLIFSLIDCPVSWSRPSATASPWRRRKPEALQSMAERARN